SHIHNKNKIIAFHLLNDYSGSPMVLKNMLFGLAQNGYLIHLFTSRGGILDDLSDVENITISYINYNFSENKILIIYRFIIAQLIFFIYGLRFGSKRCIYLINTILPFGGALAGKIKNAEVIYYYHENAAAKSGFYRVLANLMELIANKIICVSKYQYIQLGHPEKAYIIPNAIPEKYYEKARIIDHRAHFENKLILFVGSLKKFKGIIEFFNIAECLPEYNFCAVLSDTDANITTFIKAEKIKELSNVTICSRQHDLTTFYDRASIVLNLSKKEFVIETFGMTVLEAMNFGIPVIVPTVGGIADHVVDGVNGYKIDAENTSDISKTVRLILSDEELYYCLSRNAKKYSQQFEQKKMLSLLMSIFQGTSKPETKISIKGPTDIF
ncbi:MAG: glycosyltransferase family 4 protein, partial [Muribaculaceae bacterium]|nr:glycosyltransferase family 4 protein [Muribaculaceae bacterium]